MRNPYLDGNDYFDCPDYEYSCKAKTKINVKLNATNQYVFPCYVYDRHGKLLRIEYPKLKSGKKWTSRY